MHYVFLYLVAIVLANLSSAYFGISASYFNAFFFIGFDLFARDKLHEAWQNKGIIWKMGLLIALGSLITYTINKNAGDIAKASFIAFAAAAIVDTIFYQLLYKKDYLVKVNGSNVFGALTDSLVFPTIAFGGFLPLVTLGQFLAKVVGGAVWSFALLEKSKKWDFLCKIGWHKDYVEISYAQLQCPHCKQTWDYNPHWNV